MLVNWHVTGYISKLPFVTEPASLNDPHDMVFFMSVHQLCRSYKFHAVLNGILSWWDVNLHGPYLVVMVLDVLTLVDHFQYLIYCTSILICICGGINDIVKGFPDFEDTLDDLIYS